MNDPESFRRTLDQAKAAMEKVGRIDPATLYLEAYGALQDSNDPAGIDRAKPLLDQAITARPTMNGARILLARFHLAKETPALAKAELDRVLFTAPAHEEAKRLLETAAAAEKAQSEKAQSEKAQAEKAPAEKKPPGAKPDPDAPEANHPDTFEWWMARAESLRERDRTKAALDAYGRAAELRGGSAEPHTGKGWCFLDLDRPHLALASFERAIKANSRYAMAYYGLAESYRALGSVDKAIESYEEFLSRAPPGQDRATAERTLAKLRERQN